MVADVGLDLLRTENNHMSPMFDCVNAKLSHCYHPFNTTLAVKIVVLLV